MFNNIRVFIQPEDVYQYFLDYKEQLEDNMRMIASTDTDDFDKKSILFLTNECGNLLLSLEGPETIIDSEYCYEYDTIDTVNDFLIKLDKLYPITLSKKWPDSKYEDKEYICQFTKEIDKYLHGLNDVYYSYLYDYGPRKEFDGNEGYIYSIRSPGSTKGHIFIDNQGIITEVKFYDSTLKYFDPEVKKLEKEFLGYQLVKE